MKFIYISFLCAFCAASCATVDVQSKVKTASGAGKAAPEPVVVPIETEPVIVEQPVYLPQGQKPERPVGRAAVESAARGILKPTDYSKAAMIYDFHPDWVYELYTQPLRASDIQLKPGELTVDTPFISDSERWMIGAGVSYEEGIAIQHIYVKPVEAGNEASLIINTSERVYHIILRSFREVHMPKLRWRYPELYIPKNYIQNKSQTAQGEDAPSADPRFLSFNYKITYSRFKKPRWLPELVYDDGKKTYISFPEDTLRDELPAVFENRNDVINYRVAGHIIIIDKRIESITVKINKQEIAIEKKKGG